MKAVLLIEDDHELRPMIAAYLKEHGCHVIEAEDGEAGLALAHQHRPDIIVCDLLMPRCNGFQVCRTVRGTPELRDAKIVMISGRGYSCGALDGVSEYNLTINSDQTVTCNCQDYEGIGQIGNLKQNSFEEVFFGAKAQQFRDLLRPAV